MRLVIILLNLLSLFLPFTGICHARLAEAPWPMFQHDIHHTSNVLHPGLLSGVSNTPTEETTDIIYLGSLDGYLYAVDSNGNLTWRLKVGGEIEHSPALGMDGTLLVWCMSC